MTDDQTLHWLLENDPEAQGVSAEEYRRRTGIQSLAAETADVRRHLPATLLDHSNYHCAACARRAEVSRHTVG